MTGEVDVRRPVEVVFAYVADQRNEPRYNPQMLWAEKVTPGPIGVGTRFHQQMRMPGRGGRMGSQLIGFDPPASLALRSHLTWMDTVGTLTFAAAGDGTRLSWDWQVRFRGPARLLTPLLLAVGRRQERTTWEGLRRHLEEPGT
ncbi:hypothetical protein FJ693_15115 [Georgenia yuyongxinii]|uniref:SRPBCC family protein n=1 Tax=Georgenia yuyongxinii TaxID=2589797 RepID=A0A552WMZ9_9MICO|nr:hypothetical protein FJ693_15115 [Georgenia yuyongxinii]